VASASEIVAGALQDHRRTIPFLPGGGVDTLARMFAASRALRSGKISAMPSVMPVGQFIRSLTYSQFFGTH